MKHIREIMLSLGICSIFCSFLFFGFKPNLYLSLLAGGVLLSFISFILIIAKRGNAKSKWVWAAVCLIAAVIEGFSERYLLKASYATYYSLNKDNLNRLNVILSSYPQDILVDQDTLISREGSLSSVDSSNIRELFRQTNLNMIRKSDGTVYYETWGSLDIRHGVFVPSVKEPKPNPFTQVGDNWYYN